LMNPVDVNDPNKPIAALTLPEVLMNPVDVNDPNKPIAALTLPEVLMNPVEVNVPVTVGADNVLLDKVCTASILARILPPATPLWTLIVPSVVSTLSSPAAPINALFCAVDPLLNCTTVGMILSYYMLFIRLLR